jgi:hypothetical protein
MGMTTVAMPTPNPDIKRPVYQAPTPLTLMICKTAPTMKIQEARTRDHRRPKRAVKGQAKKQAKKAVHKEGKENSCQ